MATVIDELIVTLGLDPSGFTAGRTRQRTVLGQMRSDAQAIEAEIRRIHLQGASAMKAEDAKKLDALRKSLEIKKKAIRELERPEKEEIRRGKDHAETIGQVRTQLIALFAVLTAGKDLEGFVRDTINSSAGLGRMSAALGVNAQELSAWQYAVAETGGTAQDATAAVQALVKAREDWILRGDASAIGGTLSALGMTGQDLNDPIEALKKMADARRRLAAAGRPISIPQLDNLLAGIGIGQPVANNLNRGRPAVDAGFARGLKVAPSDADIATATAQQAAWVALGAASTQLGRDILTYLTPALTWLTDKLKDLSTWAKSHEDMVRAAFAGLAAGAVALGVALAAPFAGIIAFTAGVVALSTAMGLLIDDFNTFQSGGASAIDWSGMQEAVDGLRGALDDLGSALKDVYDSVDPKVWDALSDATRGFGAVIMDMVKGSLHDLTGALHDIADVIRLLVDLFTGQWSKAITDANKLVSDVTADWIRKFNDAKQAVLDFFAAQSGQPAPPRPAPGQPGAQRPAPSQPGAQSPARGTSALSDIETFFRGKGVSEVAARGIAAGTGAESQGGNYQATNPKSGAYGLGQWLGPRQADFARMFGHDIHKSTKPEQIEFMYWEMTKGPKAQRDAGAAIFAAKTDTEALNLHITRFERPKAGHETVSDLARGNAYLNRLRAAPATTPAPARPQAPAKPTPTSPPKRPDGKTSAPPELVFGPWIRGLSPQSPPAPRRTAPQGAPAPRRTQTQGAPAAQPRRTTPSPRAATPAPHKPPVTPVARPLPAGATAGAHLTATSNSTVNHGSTSTSTMTIENVNFQQPPSDARGLANRLDGVRTRYFDVTPANGGLTS